MVEAHMAGDGTSRIRTIETPGGRRWEIRDDTPLRARVVIALLGTLIGAVFAALGAWWFRLILANDDPANAGAPAIIWCTVKCEAAFLVASVGLFVMSLGIRTLRPSRTIIDFVDGEIAVRTRTEEGWSSRTRFADEVRCIHLPTGADSLMFECRGPNPVEVRLWGAPARDVNALADGIARLCEDFTGRSEGSVRVVRLPPPPDSGSGFLDVSIDTMRVSPSSESEPPPAAPFAPWGTIQRRPMCRAGDAPVIATAHGFGKPSPTCCLCSFSPPGRAGRRGGSSRRLWPTESCGPSWSPGRSSSCR